MSRSFNSHPTMIKLRNSYILYVIFHSSFTSLFSAGLCFSPQRRWRDVIKKNQSKSNLCSASDMLQSTSGKELSAPFWLQFVRLPEKEISSYSYTCCIWRSCRANKSFTESSGSSLMLLHLLLVFFQDKSYNLCTRRAIKSP